MIKDWTGNKSACFATLGAQGHALEPREQNDYYATDPKAIDYLFDKVSFSGDIWEPACGEGHLSKRMIEHGKTVFSSDLIDRGFGVGGVDFLKCDEVFSGDIITNPPYKYAKEFTEKALQLVGDGGKVAMFLKIQFLEGKARRSFFEENPPRKILVSTTRILCGKNGVFEGTSAVCYAWFVWEKGYKGNPEIEWIN